MLIQIALRRFPLMDLDRSLRAFADTGHAGAALLSGDNGRNLPEGPITRGQNLLRAKLGAEEEVDTLPLEGE